MHFNGQSRKLNLTNEMNELQLLLDRAERLEYIIRGSQLVDHDFDQCGRFGSQDLTARINALSVKLRTLPSNAGIGMLRPLRDITNFLKVMANFEIRRHIGWSECE
jgi:hypothetical protein